MIDPRIFLAAFLGILFSAAAIHGTGYDGKVAGWKIGPAKPWLMMAGR